ncbi:hypothetical protein pb186bvf_020352 [Paramecium bursaria]
MIQFPSYNVSQSILKQYKFLLNRSNSLHQPKDYQNFHQINPSVLIRQQASKVFFKDVNKILLDILRKLKLKEIKLIHKYWIQAKDLRTETDLLSSNIIRYFYHQFIDYMFRLSLINQKQKDKQSNY